MRSGRRLLIEASFRLGLAALAIKALPFRHVAPSLGTHMAKTDETPLADGSRRVCVAVARAVRIAARHLPWECKCLAQAMAAQKMLRRRRLATTLYLGLAKGGGGDERELSAHAWLRCGDMIVTGGEAMGLFTVVSMFGHEG